MRSTMTPSLPYQRFSRYTMLALALALPACGASNPTPADAGLADAARNDAAPDTARTDVSAADSPAMDTRLADAASDAAALDVAAADAGASDRPQTDVAAADRPADAAATDSVGADAAVGDAGADALPADAPPACPAQTGVGTSHQGVIEADQTWTAATGPHIVEFDLSINRGTLTIEPCVVVRVKKGYSINVGGGTGAPAAGLIARGTAAQPIRFTRAVASEAWGMLAINASATVDLENVTLSGGGDHDTAQDFGGTLKLRGPEGTTPARNTRVKNVRIEGSAGHGVNVQTAGGFTADSSGLVITDCGKVPGPVTGHDTRYAIFVMPPSIQTLPPGTYTGNALDQILVGQAMLDKEETFRDLGVPYRIEAGFAIAPAKSAAEGGLATLTIEAGVKILLLKSATDVVSFKLGTSSGGKAEEIWPVKLVAAGTADRPIVFTSAAATPAAGDWGALYWSGGPSTGNVMSYVRVEYAGADVATSGFGCGPNDNDAGIVIANWRPATAFMDHVTISDSAGGGIVSGWISDMNGPNLKTGNTFTRIRNGCDVARWANATSPACPANPPVCL